MGHASYHLHYLRAQKRFKSSKALPSCSQMAGCSADMWEIWGIGQFASRRILLCADRYDCVMNQSLLIGVHVPALFIGHSTPGLA